MKALTMFLAGSLIAGSLFSQSIQINSSIPSNLCAGASIYVHFQATGTFNSGNQFKIEHSNEYGTFNNSIYSQGTNADSIQLVVSGVYPGKYYRIRIRSTNPVVLSADNGTDIYIHGLPRAAPAASSLVPLENDSIKLFGGGFGGTGQYIGYQWAGPNGFTSSLQNPVILNAQPANTGSYMLKVEDTQGCWTYYGDTLPLLITNQPLITQQPQSQTISSGTPVDFSVAVTGTPALQWYVSQNNGIGWSPMVNNSTYQGVTTDTLHVLSTYYNLYGAQYKCRISFPVTGDIYSNTAILTIKNSTLITWIDTVFHCQNANTQIKIPVKVKNFHQVGAITLTIDFSDTVLQYVSCIVDNPAMAQSPNCLFANNSLPLNHIDEFRFMWWYDASPVDIADSAVMFSLVFNVIGNETAITFWVENELCEYANTEGWIIPEQFVNGYVQSAACSDLDGSFAYQNTDLTPMGNVTLTLNKNGVIKYTAITNSAGYYHFTDIPPGQYQPGISCPFPPGGFNSIDALLALQHFVNSITLTGLNKKAADVNLSGFINAADALMIMRRFTGNINTFPAGDWLLSQDVINITGSGGLQTQNLQALCTGDVNASFVP